jgi:type III pantothenate kinase
MDLLVDVGNTRTKYALVESGRITVVSENTVFDYFPKIARAFIANVTDASKIQALKDKLLNQGINPVDVKVRSNQFGVTCAYKKTKNLGIDRWLAIIGATHQFPNEAIIVVDAGTAVTIDVVNKEKQHLGGWILPGLKTMEDSIVSKAPHVFSDENIPAERFGTDTPSALRQGCLAAISGTVIQAINEYQHLQCGMANNEPTIVLTGGDAKLVASKLDRPLIIQNDLVFLGLSLFLDE